MLNMNCKYEICRRCPKSGLFKGSLKECDDWIKQKQKDEIKDKISMALKDPILQQAFEIICKENVELKEQLGDKVMQKQKDKADLVWKLKTANEQKASQLTKAKKIIKDYLIIAKGGHTTVCGVPEENRTIYVLKLNEEAEQFLNGEVKKPIESSVDHIIEQDEKEVGLNPDYFSSGW